MKALTLWNPWAALIALGHKKIETRCWQTKYRGELAIHAAAKTPSWLGASRHSVEFRNALADIFNARRDCDDRSGFHVDDAIKRLPYGKVVCIVRLLEIEETSQLFRDLLCDQEKLFGNFEDGRYAWHLELLEVFDEPIPVKGNRQIWNWQSKSVR